MNNTSHNDKYSEKQIRYCFYPVYKCWHFIFFSRMNSCSAECSMKREFLILHKPETIFILLCFSQSPTLHNILYQSSFPPDTRPWFCYSAILLSSLERISHNPSEIYWRIIPVSLISRGDHPLQIHKPFLLSCHDMASWRDHYPSF